MNKTIEKNNILLNQDELAAGVAAVMKKYSGVCSTTKIVYRYAVYYANEYISAAVLKDNKELYLKLIAGLVQELAAAGVTIGKDWKDAGKFPMKKGNSKLGKDTVILNIGAAVTCSSKIRGLCRVCGLCYAENAERQYLNTLIYRLNQALRFAALSAAAIADQVLRRRNIEYIRFNESGDLFNVQDLEKIKEIAKICYERKGLITYIYTAAGAEFKKYQTSYFKINISGRDYVATPNLKGQDGVLYCSGDCPRCLYCKYEFGLPVLVKYHGSNIPDGTGHDLRTAGVKYTALNHQYFVYYQHMYLKKYGPGYLGGVAVTAAAGGDNHE